MKKILTVLGARPQFVKAAVVSRNIAGSKFIEELIVHTGQHYDSNMSDIFFSEMEIPAPNYNLNINGLDHGAMTGQMLEKIEEVIKKENPDLVLVYGDTNSTLAGSLAAKKMQIPVAHVEAGLRSFNMNMPEEINRILTDRISDILFCPTQHAIANLRREGFDSFNVSILHSGDVMFDAAKYYLSKAKKPNYVIPKEYALCTIHRGENTDNPKILQDIFNGLETISKIIPIVLPLHPRTKKKLDQLNFDYRESTILFIDPVSYFEMIYLIVNSTCVITDSGGLQKEAYFFRKRCIITREETEWIELVEHGNNIISGSNSQKLVDSFRIIKSTTDTNYDEQLYGDGNSGRLIVDEITKYLT